MHIKIKGYLAVACLKSYNISSTLQSLKYNFFAKFYFNDPSVIFHLSLLKGLVNHVTSRVSDNSCLSKVTIFY